MSYNEITARILQLLGSVCGHIKPPVNIHEPSFSENDKNSVVGVLDNNWVSTAGPEVTQFETALKNKLNIRNCIAVNSGTSALHLALKSYNIGPGDIVILPSLGFIASANAVSYVGAEPHFIDVDPVHGLLDIRALEEYLEQNPEKKIKAIVFVCLFGLKNDPAPLIKIAKERGLIVIEDAAGALGSKFSDQFVGSDFDATIFSFNGNKIITTGAGGALCIKHDAVSEKALHLANVAKTFQEVVPTHDEVAFNYRMPNINAALGLPQLENLGEKILKKEILKNKYKHQCNNLGLKILEDPPGSLHNNWLINLKLDAILDMDEAQNRLSHIVKACHHKGYIVRPVWQPLHKTIAYGDAHRTGLPNTEILSKSVISLPSSEFI